MRRLTRGSEAAAFQLAISCGREVRNSWASQLGCAVHTITAQHGGGKQASAASRSCATQVGACPARHAPLRPPRATQPTLAHPAVAGGRLAGGRPVQGQCERHEGDGIPGKEHPSLAVQVHCMAGRVPRGQRPLHARRAPGAQVPALALKYRQPAGRDLRQRHEEARDRVCSVHAWWGGALPRCGAGQPAAGRRKSQAGPLPGSARLGAMAAQRQALPSTLRAAKARHE